jgi:hypothetical protein
LILETVLNGNDDLSQSRTHSLIEVLVNVAVGYPRSPRPAMTDRPAISANEMQRRRRHVETAIADSRIEGFPPPSAREKAIFDAYIRGEIDASDLVTEYKRRNPPPTEDG